MSEEDLTRTEEEAWIGREVGGKYRILQLVGRGGMGSVYEAENLALGKRVALKFIDAESARNTDGLQRFEREARAAGTIESAHIVQVFDVGELDDGRPYIVMELLRGENLGARMQRLGRLSAAEVVHVAVQVLRGLHRAHEKGIIHRDLKPENIFLVETDGDPMFAKIVDFGISKFMRRSKVLDRSTITQQGVVLGTPFYMAPEQARSVADLDERADLWSVGAILYECLAGRRPFTGETYEQVIIAICTTPAPDLLDLAPDVPPPLAQVVMRALAQQRDKRYASARDFLTALQTAVPDLVGAVPASFDPTTTRAVPAASIARDEPRTDVSWSSVGNRVAAGTSLPSGKSRNTKLALVGGTTALLAFGVTVAIMTHMKRTDPDASLVQNHLPIQVVASADPLPAMATASPTSAASATATVSLRIETSAPGAVVRVDGEPATDGLLRGALGGVHTVTVSAPGFEKQEREVVLQEGVKSIRIDLAKAPSSGVQRPVKEAKTPRPPASESGSLTGGLELKTDIP